MIVVAPDTVAAPPDGYTPIYKQPGEARFIFVARIHPSKNLLGALCLLNGFRGQVSLDIFGPVDDAKYWKACQAEMPENAAYHGPIPHEQIVPAFQRSHFFLFPTFTESFGHAIYESLGAGRPVITSTGTPWQDLPRYECGWWLPLRLVASWRWVLQRCVDMDNAEYQSICQRAHRYARDWYDEQDFVGQYRNLFHTALNLMGNGNRTHSLPVKRGSARNI